MTEAPTLDLPGSAADAAQAWLGPGYLVDRDTMVPNPLQGLWIVSYTDEHGHALDGSVLAVESGGKVRTMSSSPGAEEYQGAIFPPDDEVYEDDEPEEDDVEMAALLSTFGVGEFGPAGQDFDETVCIMAIPAEGWEGHGIGPEEKHATVLYFGKRSEHEDPERMESARGVLAEALSVVAQETAPFSAAVTAVEPLGDEGAQVWLLDSPDLQRVFEEVPEVDSEVQSLYDGAAATRYPEYLPHVTIGYTGDDSAGSETGQSVTDEDLARAEEVEAIPFDRLSLWWGNERQDFPLGAAEFDALLEQFGGWDPTAHPRDDKGSPTGGRFKKPGQDKGDGEGGPERPTKSPEPKGGTPSKPGVDEDEPMTKSEKVKALVEGVLDALDKVMASLTSEQARALVERIKDNAEAFISGQEAAPHKGGGGSKGGGGGSKDKGGSPKSDKTGKDTSDTKGGSSGEGSDSGGGGKASGVAGIVAGVKSLIKQFGNQMKPGDRDQLKKAVDALDAS